ncbi:Phosphoribosyl-AMP cyclohydrolase [Ensifer psoraleae]|nr:Phosphoribosyl-AMP cyclohydrolase [Sinorhizobium psoraleae]
MTSPLNTRRPVQFGPRLSVEAVEEGAFLAPRFDADGLIPVVTTDATSGEVLMMGVMNAHDRDGRSPLLEP